MNTGARNIIVAVVLLAAAGGIWWWQTSPGSVAGAGGDAGAVRVGRIEGPERQSDPADRGRFRPDPRLEQRPAHVPETWQVANAAGPRGDARHERLDEEGLRALARSTPGLTYAEDRMLGAGLRGQVSPGQAGVVLRQATVLTEEARWVPPERELGDLESAVAACATFLATGEPGELLGRGGQDGAGAALAERLAAFHAGLGDGARLEKVVSGLSGELATAPRMRFRFIRPGGAGISSKDLRRAAAAFGPEGATRERPIVEGTAEVAYVSTDGRLRTLRVVAFRDPARGDWRVATLESIAVPDLGEVMRGHRSGRSAAVDLDLHEFSFLESAPGVAVVAGRGAMEVGP